MTRELDYALGYIKAAKEGAVVEAGGDPDAHVLFGAFFFRGGEHVASVYPARPHPAALLFAARNGACGFGADFTALAYDTYATGSLVNPVTGQPWRRDEMGEVANHHDGRVKGWVRDAVGVAAADRAGARHRILVPYTVAAGHVQWGTQTDLDSPDVCDVAMGGPLVDTLTAVMAEPALTPGDAPEEVAATILAGDPEQVRAVMDAATARALERMGLPCAIVLSAPPGSVRAEMFSAYLPDSEVLRADTAT